MTDQTPEPSNTEDAVAQALAERLIPMETAEETLDRIYSYATSAFLPPGTRIALIRAAVLKWRGGVS